MRGSCIVAAVSERTSPAAIHGCKGHDLEQGLELGKLADVYARRGAAGRAGHGGQAPVPRRARSWPGGRTWEGNPPPDPSCSREAALSSCRKRWKI